MPYLAWHETRWFRWPLFFVVGALAAAITWHLTGYVPGTLAVFVGAVCSAWHIDELLYAKRHPDRGCSL